jgi:hypothetical protein
VFYLSFVNVCMNIFSEVIKLKQVVHLLIILSSHSCIVVSWQVNCGSQALALLFELSPLNFSLSQ